ncbi:hypothetical protein [Roseovarius sp. MMSF_3281]|uniref:hypothetical protein n=1 Tax=Roseovarius sp. MMSF_3281 TaxID=3046694 RepID=UPI00273FDD51|nr:hypothetical protein [Roseovarius sp. MMSF_3281]
MLRALAVTLLCLAAGGASAGPWPRTKGETFLSTSLEAGDTDTYGALYAEYGAAPSLTLGLDLGSSLSRTKQAIAFARWPVGNTDTPLRMAVQLGLGYAERWRIPPFKLVVTGGGPLPALPAARPKMRPVVQTGFSIGKGIKLLGRNGWLSLDTRAEADDALATTYQADATVGLTTRKGHMLIVQLQTGATDAGQSWASLAPSVVMELSDSTHVELGVTASVTGGHHAARLGLWQKF